MENCFRECTALDADWNDDRSRSLIGAARRLFTLIMALRRRPQHQLRAAKLPSRRKRTAASLAIYYTGLWHVGLELCSSPGLDTACLSTLGFIFRFGNSQGELNTQHGSGVFLIYSVSQKIPPEVLWHFFRNGCYTPIMCSYLR